MTIVLKFEKGKEMEAILIAFRDELHFFQVDEGSKR
jgi:hypothetical protein